MPATACWVDIRNGSGTIPTMNTITIEMPYAGIKAKPTDINLVATLDRLRERLNPVKTSDYGNAVKLIGVRDNWQELIDEARQAMKTADFDPADLVVNELITRDGGAVSAKPYPVA